MSGVNPEGCQVHSFKRPSAEELEHDFLWRAVKLLPPRRMIGVFNRSYYEEVLIVRVHPELLGQEEGGVAATRESGSGKKLHRVWQERYESIVNLEKHLCRNGTRIIKFFLHISKDEQRKRLLKRLDDPKKNWKLDKVDVEERKFWNQYMSAYEKCLSKTSKILSPWYIVPADDKDNAHLIISQIIIDNLNQLKMDYPKPQRDRVKELRIMRKTLSAGD
jgi:PPK2 family polyphosphate:nucleotide phosphotransferase